MLERTGVTYSSVLDERFQLAIVNLKVFLIVGFTKGRVKTNTCSLCCVSIRGPDGIYTRQARGQAIRCVAALFFCVVVFILFLVRESMQTTFCLPFGETDLAPLVSRHL